MKLLLLSCVLLLSLSVQAQQRPAPVADAMATPARLPSLQKAVPDTLFTSILNDACFANGITPFFLPDTGYLVGSNIFGDIAQLQRIEVPAGNVIKINQLDVFMAISDSTSLDVPVSAIVFSDLDADGDVTALGSSDTITIAETNRDTTGGLIRTTLFNFSEPVRVTAGSFLIGIDFSQAYSTDGVLFAGLYSTGPDCGDGDNLVQITATNDGPIIGTFAEYYGGANIEIPMFVAVDIEPVTATRPVIADYAATIAPNPTDQVATLRFSADASEDPRAYRSSLSDLTGRTVLTSLPVRTGQGMSSTFDLSLLPAGLYLFHVDGPAGRQSGKVIKR